jgi:hypothetical protein
MMDNTHIYKTAFFIATIFCLSCLAFACSKSDDKSQEKQRQAALERKYASLQSKPDQELVALLAAKYGKDVGLVEQVIDLYLTEMDWGYRLLKNALKVNEGELTQSQYEESIRKLSETDTDLMFHTLDRSAYSKMVDKIAGQFSLEPPVVASILLDYKTCKATDEAASRTRSE